MPTRAAGSAIPPTGHVYKTPRATPTPNSSVLTLLRDIALPARQRLRHVKHVSSGGMGEVSVTEDMGLERIIARKTIHRELNADERSQVAFVREARVTGQLEHPHIVPVHDVGVDSTGRLYFTMKLVEGRTFREQIRALPPGPLPHHTLIDQVDVVIKICQALAFAHSRGVVHLDVKPSNIMVGDFGEVYLMDWGVARIHSIPPPVGQSLEPSQSGVHSSEPDLPTRRAIAGTPSHMAPEQALGEDELIDARSDVFAVGALLYEILTRRPPYRADTVLATLVMAASGKHADVQRAAGERNVPDELARIVRKAMAKERDDRYQRVDELREDLVRFTRGGGEFPNRVYAAGEDIVTQGTPGDEAYLIIAGRCEVFIGDERIREMGAGDAFGEMAILSPGPRTATVRALTETTVEVVNRRRLEQELDAMKPWMANFVRTLAERFRERES